MSDRRRKHEEPRLSVIPPKRLTGYLGEHWRRGVPSLRPGFHKVVNQPMAGDAPKDFVRVYEFGVGHKSEPNTWPAYIAKVGHKWYPAESVTEQLMTRIGQLLGIRMAESRLMAAGDQIRFLSKYFLRPNESLVHGAEIVAGYLEDDNFVQHVGAQQLEREIFTFQVLCRAISTRFPSDAETILADFVRMLAFDCLVGNQDRHLYNWGVVVHARGRRPPRFSPIYDTARGLYWNVSEAGLAPFGTPPKLLKYVKNGNPLIGWDGDASTVNHFGLVSNVGSSDPKHASTLKKIAPVGALPAIREMIETEFEELFSGPRRRAIVECLSMRFEMFEAAL